MKDNTCKAAQTGSLIYVVPIIKLLFSFRLRGSFASTVSAVSTDPTPMTPSCVHRLVYFVCETRFHEMSRDCVWSGG